MARVLVDGGVLANQGIHIGNGDQDAHRAIGQHLAGRELVEIARVVVVDGAPEQAGQVTHFTAMGLAEVGDGGELVQRCRREFRLEAAFAHGAYRQGFQIVLFVVGVFHAVFLCCGRQDGGSERAGLAAVP